MADPLARLRAVLEALPAGPVSIEPHGDGEALYFGREDPPPGQVVGGHHGLNVVHLTDPAHQWPEVRRAIAALGTLWPALLAVAEAVDGEVSAPLDAPAIDAANERTLRARRALLAAIDAALPEVTDAGE